MATSAQITAAQMLTSTTEIVKGFLFQARLKRRVARPFVESAITFVNALTQATSMTEIVTNQQIRPQLMAAAGFSQKSLGHLIARPETLQRELRLFLQDVEGGRGQNWQAEVIQVSLHSGGYNRRLDAQSHRAASQEKTNAIFVAHDQGSSSNGHPHPSCGDKMHSLATTSPVVRQKMSASGR